MNGKLDVLIDFSLCSGNDGNRLGSVDFDFVVNLGINGIFLFLNPDYHSLSVVFNFPVGPFVDFSFSKNNPGIGSVLVVKENINLKSINCEFGVMDVEE